jgi:hypothetical protein
MGEEHGAPRKSASSLLGKTSTLGVCLVLLICETWIFLCRSKDWDLYSYQRYAQSYHESSLAAMYARHTVEYPPLAILLMLGANEAAGRLPDCSTLGGVFRECQGPRPLANFKFVYRLAMAAATFATFWLLLPLSRRFLGREALSERWERLLTFTLAVGILGHFAFDRLDMVLAGLIVLALSLLSGAGHFLWSFLVLALAIAFKIVPVVLIPFWVLGSLPVPMLAPSSGAGWRRLLATAVGRGILLAALTLAFLAPFSCWPGTVLLPSSPTTRTAASSSNPVTRPCSGPCST